MYCKVSLSKPFSAINNPHPSPNLSNFTTWGVFKTIPKGEVFGFNHNSTIFRGYEHLFTIYFHFHQATKVDPTMDGCFNRSTISLVDDYDGRYRNWNWHLIWRLFMNQVVVMGLYSTNLASGNSTVQWSQSDQRKLRARIVSVPGLRTLFVELKTMMSLWPLPSLTIPYPHYQDIESEALGFDSLSQGNCAPRGTKYGWEGSSTRRLWMRFLTSTDTPGRRTPSYSHCHQSSGPASGGDGHVSMPWFRGE